MAKATGASWAFVLGVIIAILLGIVNYFAKAQYGSLTKILGIILIIMGLIIGFMNVTAKEAPEFMTAGAVMVLVAFLSGNVFSSLWFVPDILDSILMLFTPAVMITALKVVWGLAATK